jgi:hypothetical protein
MRYNKSMNRLAIGDIHGRDFWKHYLQEDFDEYYILGDYFDSNCVSFKSQMRNFLEIISAAQDDPRLKLCLGNHDFHYVLDDPRERYSSFQENHAGEIHDALVGFLYMIKIVYQTADNIIISHAGLSHVFMEQFGIAKALDINERFKADKRILCFNGFESHGDDVTQGPLWIRPEALLQSAIPGFSQIAGHTPVPRITKHSLDKEGHTLTLIDTYDTESIYRF